MGSPEGDVPNEMQVERSNSSVAGFVSVATNPGLCPAGESSCFMQALTENQKQLRQYQWVETIVISMNGEQKSQTQKQCFYGPAGKVQKQQQK